MEAPLVSVICIAYNHGPYVYQALSSLRDQSYSNIEVIIADDHSTDNTQKEVQRFLDEHPSLQWKFIIHTSNQGNCKTFNEAFQYARGRYLIDLAADDYIHKSCIEKQVSCFEKCAEQVGVVFCNVEMVDVDGNFQYTHYPITKDGRASIHVPQGNVYEEIVKRYFISPVGMMVKASVMRDLGGYDESLAYEDFDFWVRSSRKYEYAYLDECVVCKRETPSSLSTRFRKEGYDAMFESTARVCQKIAWLNQKETEKNALLRRIHYEMRQALKYKATGASRIYLQLMKDLGVNPIVRHLYVVLVKVLT